MAATGAFSVRGSRAWEMPGTAAFFSAFIAIFASKNAAIIAIRIVQAVLLLLQAFLVGKIARRIFDDRAIGSSAFVMTALYPFLVYYQGLLLSETLFNTFLIAAIASLYWWRDRGFRLDAVFLVTCWLFALALYTKATLTVLPPFLIAAATLSARNWRLTLRAALVSALIYAALLTPWWWRNYTVLGVFVPFTTSAAANLYVGNNPRNTSGGIDWGKDVDPAVVARIDALPNEIQRQRAYGAEAVRYITGNPVAFLRLVGLKFIRFWNIVPNASEFGKSIYRIISIASFGPVLILSIVSAIIWRRRLLAFAPLLLLFAYFTIVHVVTIASLRYRLPIEPFLIALAAAPVGTVLRRFGWWTAD